MVVSPAEDLPATWTQAASSTVARTLHAIGVAREWRREPMLLVAVLIGLAADARSWYVLAHSRRTRLPPR